MSDGTGAPSAVKRFEWERLIRGADLHPTAKLVALTMATYANRDGSNIHPGVERLRQDCGVCGEKTIRRHIAALLEAGFVRKTFSGSSQGRRALADVYCLTARPDVIEAAAAAREHRSSDLRSPVIEDGTPVTGDHPPAHEHHEVHHQSSAWQLDHDAAASGRDTKEHQLEDEDRVEIVRARLEAWKIETYGESLSLDEDSTIDGMYQREEPFPFIENTIRARVRKAHDEAAREADETAGIATYSVRCDDCWADAWRLCRYANGEVIHGGAHQARFTASGTTAKAA